MVFKFVNSGSMERGKLNCLLSLWYGIIAGLLQAYLVAHNVWKFVRFAELPWPKDQTPSMELNIFIALNGFAVLLLPFFVTACFLRVGNLANDNDMLGKSLRCHGNKIMIASTVKSSTNLFLSLWRHCGPISSILHIICSICLIFPQTLMDGVLINQGFLPKDEVWRSDLDFLNSKEPEDMVVRPIEENNAAASFARQVLPLTSKPNGIRIEFVNFAIALFIFSTRYAQVYWSSHKRFAVLFGLQQIVNNIHMLISFSTMMVLYKIHVSKIFEKSTPFLLDGQMTLLIFSISFVVLFCSASVLYYLGYMKFASFLQDNILKRYIDCSGESNILRNWSYFPHSAAVAVALALTAAQSPLLHDAFIVFQVSSKVFVMAYSISCMVHFLIWAFLWLCLTLKKSWIFNVNMTVVQSVEGLNSNGLPTEISVDFCDNSTTGPFSPSLVVINEGKAYSVNNADDQKSILALLPQAAKTPEPIYWKQTTATPTPSCLSYKSNKDHSKIKYTPCRKEVTFDDELQSRYISRVSATPDKNSSEKTYCPNSADDFDEGEYAYLSSTRGSKGPLDSSTSQSVYGSLQPKINFSERNTVASPVSTVDSSSGVSSIGSHCGPPSASASCSQFSECVMNASEEQQAKLSEPRAHYESVRLPSRRNSMRASINSPQNAHDSVYQKVVMESIYGKLKEGKSVARSESIYSSLSGKQYLENRNRASVSGYETESNSHRIASDIAKFSKCNNEPLYVTKKLNASSAVAEDNTCTCGHTEDTNPPIPPPLPILNFVSMNNYSLNSSDDDPSICDL